LRLLYSNACAAVAAAAEIIPADAEIKKTT
jgi:hypothetical protein